MIIAVDTHCILPGQVGGIENYTLGLIESLQLPGSPASQLVLLTRTENHSLFQRFESPTTRCVLQPRQAGSWTGAASGNRSSLSQFQAQKRAIFAQQRVDLVHFPGNTINPIDVALPVVLNLHDLQHRHFPHYFSQAELDNRETWWTASAHRADALLAASDFVRDDLHQQLGVDRSKIFVTPDRFESAFFVPPTAAQLLETRRRCNLPDRFLIYPAAAWPHKNHQRLIHAFAEFAPADVQLVLTGGAQAESALPQLIESLGISDRVRLLGRVETSDLIALYHLATGMIFPSLHESWSIPIMEAMACGCPVACSNITSLPEEIADAGLLFEPGDVRSIGSAILQLLGGEELRRLLNRRGKARVRTFNSEHFLATVTRAYRHARASFSLSKAA